MYKKYRTEGLWLNYFGDIWKKIAILVNFWEPFEDEVNQSELNKDPIILQVNKVPIKGYGYGRIN